MPVNPPISALSQGGDMIYEQFRKIVQAAVMSFIQSQAEKNEMYITSEDVYAGDLFSLPANRAVRVTFEYVDLPRVPVSNG